MLENKVKPRHEADDFTIEMTDGVADLGKEVAAKMDEASKDESKETDSSADSSEEILPPENDDKKDVPVTSVEDKEQKTDAEPAKKVEKEAEKAAEVSETKPATLDSIEAKLVSLTGDIQRIQKEIWYTRIALVMFLVITLIFVKLCISDVNDTMGMFLQFMMSTLQGTSDGN